MNILHRSWLSVAVIGLMLLSPEVQAQGGKLPRPKRVKPHGSVQPRFSSIRPASIGGSSLRFDNVSLPSGSLPANVEAAKKEMQPVVPREKIRNLVAKLGGGVTSDLLPQVPQKDMPLLQYTFRVRPAGNINKNFVSGTLFQMEYDGKKEIYGVIPAHALADSSWWSLDVPGRYFTADVFDAQAHRFVSVPAEVVQLSAPEFLDVALVKFHPEDEKLLSALPLRTSMPAWGSTSFQMQGFAGGEVVYIPERNLVGMTPFSVRTTMPYPREKRRGLCGSLVIGENFIGIHTGSTLGNFGKGEDIGYVTPGWAFAKLVEAYHHDGQAKIPIEIDGKTLVELNIDEYISEIVFLDQDKNEIRYEIIEAHFPYKRLKEKIEVYRPTYLEITVERVHWDEKYAYFVVDTSQQSAEHAKVYHYDMRNGNRELLPPGSPESRLSKFLNGFTH